MQMLFGNDGQDRYDIIRALFRAKNSTGIGFF
jgi:hypothetical protein